MLRRHGRNGTGVARLLLIILMVAGIVPCSIMASIVASVQTAQTAAAGPGTTTPTLAGGYSFSLLVCSDGTLWSMGLNNRGQLGLGDYVDRWNPTQVGSATNWKAVDAQWWHSLGVRSDGTLWGWGRNGDGQLGLGYIISSVNVPTRVGSATSWKAVSTGQSHSLGLRSDGTIWAWGNNAYGQLGQGDNVTRTTPTQVGSDTDWVAVSGRWNHSLALRSNGTLWAWGYNGYGELGLGDKYSRYSPTRVGNANNWVTIASDLSYTLGIRSDGTLWGWGYNYKGNLGLGDEIDRLEPTRVGTATNWTAVAPGRVHCLGLRSDGTLWGWGSNYEGELGTGDTAGRLSPARVGSATNWLAMAPGDAHSVGWRTDGTLWGWGRNWYGELGLGGYIERVLVPTQVNLSAELPLSVTTLPASGISATGATLNGNLTGRGSASAVQVSFEWGLTTSYGNTTTPQSKTSTGAFSFALGGLTPQTTYHFRAKAIGDSTVYGSDMTFATTAATITPPAVTTGDASNVGLDSAQFNGNLTSLGTASSVSVSFQWGTTPGVYGDETMSQVKNSTGAFQSNLSGLASGVTYYYRARATGDGTSYGPERSLTTATPPTVTTGDASGITAVSATLNGNLTSLGAVSSVNVSFQWGTTSGAYNYETTPEVKNSIGTFHFNLSNLASGTTYYYRARVVVDGITGYGLQRSLTTNRPPAVATNDASGITTTSGTLNGNLTSLGAASNVRVSFQWGTTPGFYGYETTPEAKNSTGAFQFKLSNLASGTTFYYRAKVVGEVTSYGLEKSLTAAALPEVTTNDASGITTISARLNGDLASMGSASSITVCFAWGTSPASYPYETTVQAMMSTGSFHFDLGSLTPGTTYYYKAKMNGDGEAVYGLEKSFNTGRSPVVADTDPDSSKRGQVLTVTVSGANFDGATAVSFASDIAVEGFIVNSSTEITAEIAIDADAEIGARDISVTTGWGTGTKTDGFSVAGGEGGICSGGASATPGAPSEMTTTLAALGILFGAGYWLQRKGRKNRSNSACAQWSAVSENELAGLASRAVGRSARSWRSADPMCTVTGKCHTEDLGAGSIHGPQQWSAIVASSLNPL